MARLSRRTLLLAGATAAGIGYAHWRGLRYPRLTWSPDDTASSLDAVDWRGTFEQVIATPDRGLRAIGPNPELLVQLKTASASISLNNVSTQAQLSVQSDGALQVDETIEGITRRVQLKGQSGGEVKLTWQWRDQGQRQFAVIGDSGGGDELTWCLQRAHALGADFLLHLGDFNYAPDEYESAINTFYSAEIPCFITIGNHDFNDKGLVYRHFLNYLGRFNHSFSIVGTQFLNIDTAASFFPVRGGQRGQFLNQLIPTKAPSIAFSHRPFVDIRAGEDHTLSSATEAEFLRERLAFAGCTDYLCGHVHKSGETDVDGLRQWTVGEGLGYEDWVARKPVSQLLMGHITPGEAPRFEWADLAMPWAMHTSHEHLEKLLKEQPQSVIDWYLQHRPTT